MSKLKGGVKKTYELTSYIRDFNAAFIDDEFDKAASAKENPQYYRCQMNNGGWAYHFYKPSVAAVLSKRDGMKHIPVPYGEAFNAQNNIKKQYPTQNRYFSWTRGKYYENIE